MQHLNPGATLQNGKYRIEHVLGQGGFGITYLAIQSGLDRKVAVKEFFMKELCERDETTSHVTLGTEGSRETVNRFREKFLKEARNIARLNHPNIVRIIDVFEENGTAYYVMEYAENGSLADKVKREGYLSEPVATRYILQVAEALEYIHQKKMNHLDVKPANIMLNEKDECVLIDFGLSKQYDAVTSNQTSTTPVGISEGYAPMEQYKIGGVREFTPETDIYALGATFFKLLTGATPPSASDVNEDGVPVNELKAKGVSSSAIAVISKAMEGRKKDRTESVNAFVNNLSRNSNNRNKPEESEVTVLAVEPEEEKPSTSKKKTDNLWQSIKNYRKSTTFLVFFLTLLAVFFNLGWTLGFIITPIASVSLDSNNAWIILVSSMGFISLVGYYLVIKRVPWGMWLTLAWPLVGILFIISLSCFKKKFSPLRKTSYYGYMLANRQYVKKRKVFLLIIGSCLCMVAAAAILRFSFPTWSDRHYDDYNYILDIAQDTIAISWEDSVIAE